MAENYRFPLLFSNVGHIFICLLCMWGLGFLAHFWFKALNLGSGRDTVGKCTGPKWSKMVQTTILVKIILNGRIPNWILAFARPKWTKMDQHGPFWPEEAAAHFGPFRSANRTLAIPENSKKVSQEYYRNMTWCEATKHASGALRRRHPHACTRRSAWLWAELLCWPLPLVLRLSLRVSRPFSLGKLCPLSTVSRKHLWIFLWTCLGILHWK